jgi:hypothetical protein
LIHYNSGKTAILAKNFDWTGFSDLLAVQMQNKKEIENKGKKKKQ